jgi:hypothetical protein
VADALVLFSVLLHLVVMADSTAAMATSTLKKKHASISLHQENMNVDRMERVKEE